MLTTLVLLASQLLGTLLLETRLAQYAIPELLLIVVGLATAITIFYGEYQGERWSHAMGTGFYAISAANLTFLYFQTNMLGFYIVLLVLALVGVVRSVSELDREDDWLHEYYAPSKDYSLETYQSSAAEQVIDPDPVYVNFAREEWKASPQASVVTSTETPKRKKKSTRKTSKKKSSKKRKK